MSRQRPKTKAFFKTTQGYYDSTSKGGLAIKKNIKFLSKIYTGVIRLQYTFT